MGFWDDLRRKIIETCIEYGERYVDACEAVLEDISRIQSMFERRKGKGGGGK